MSLRSQTVADVCVTIVCISLSLFLYKSRSSAGGVTYHRPQAYLLHNQVTHARLLPVNASNAFTYPTLAFLVSISALEGRFLDLGRGWIFGYGGIWGRVTGLRPEPYLTKQTGSIKSKLEDLLRARGHLDEKRSLHDAWMMTMPSFLGYEGINPLTVYFCYNSEGTFWSTVLEIHNTFGESHIHVLEIGKNEDSNPPNGYMFLSTTIHFLLTPMAPFRYNHQWTFPREFHVSPFNDRSGFYTVSVKRPTHPPLFTDITSSQRMPSPPKPSVRVHLFTSEEEDSSKVGALKLTALLRPARSTPLTSHSLLFSLVKAPFELLLTTPRILFVAWKLHYKKRLDVFLRPEPHPVAYNRDLMDRPRPTKPSGGVKWLDEGLLEYYARRRIEMFLSTRARETGIEVAILAPDPGMPPLIYSPDGSASPIRLTVSYLSSRMFSILCLCPSAEHALLLGCEAEKIFRVSSKELFIAVFSSTTPPLPTTIPDLTRLQRLRSANIPGSLGIPIPTSHFLDEKDGFGSKLGSGLLIFSHQFLDWFEKWVFTIVKARVVEGQEPWKQWDRVADICINGCLTVPNYLQNGSTIGSVIRAA
ncbi:hypothetical protein CVT25_013122 [Psilocybe cyanescens]|uniref:DUF1365 domain-containing protein n=1 Tax=Psilocybe cyanescens TaxID=93625 RepID=A0A409XHR8_PSICY|nr:hypothetical protein CVT25_013122 [Psilocybe cyanescens]